MRTKECVSGQMASVWTGPIEQFNRPGDLPGQYLLDLFYNELKQTTII